MEVRERSGLFNIVNHTFQKNDVFSIFIHFVFIKEDEGGVKEKRSSQRNEDSDNPFSLFTFVRKRGE